MLAWIDIETTGLSVWNDALLEVGIAITGDDLRLLQKHSYVVQCSRQLHGLDPVVREMHTKNGLLVEIVNDAVALPRAFVEECLIDIMRSVFVDGPPPMCGSSVHFDRAFLKAHMPEFEKCFHYRNIDISTVKELVNRWHPHPGDLRRPRQLKLHRVDPDLTDTINEAFFYKELLFAK